MLAFLDWLTFDGLLKALRDAAVAIYEWFRDLVWGLLSPLFDSVASAVEAVGAYVSTLATSLGAVSDCLAFANAWVPIDLFFQLVTVYSVLAAALFVYRTVKSWIPTLSGS